MTTLQITHSSFINHDTGEWHPERPERMKAIEQALSSARFQNLITVEAPAATPDQVARAHPRAYVDQLEKKQPKTDLIALDDGDTSHFARKLGGGLARRGRCNLRCR